MSADEHGITEEDRRKMGEWLREGTPVPSAAAPDPKHPTVEKTRQEVRRRHALGERIVKARSIAAKTDLTGHQVGQALRTLAEEGMVEKANTNPTFRWRITL